MSPSPECEERGAADVEGIAKAIGKQCSVKSRAVAKMDKPKPNTMPAAQNAISTSRESGP